MYERTRKMDNEERAGEGMQTRKKWRLLIKSGKPRGNLVPTARHHQPFYFRICLAALVVSKCLFCRRCRAVRIRWTNPLQKKSSYSLRAHHWWITISFEL